MLVAIETKSSVLVCLMRACLEALPEVLRACEDSVCLGRRKADIRLSESAISARCARCYISV